MAKKSLKDLSTDDLDDPNNSHQAALPIGGDEDDASTRQIDEMLKGNDLDGGTIRLSRRGPTDNGFSYIGKMRISEFDLDNIKKVYGGGDYQGQTFRANGQMGKKISFSIDARFRGIIDPQDKSNAAAPSNPMDLPRLIDALKDRPDTGQADLIKMMMKSSESNMMLMMQMMQQSTQIMVAAMQSNNNRPIPVAPAPDNSVLTAMMPVLIEMIRSNNGGKGGSITEIVAAIKAIKSINEDDKDVPEKEEESFGMKLVKALGPVVLPALTGQGSHPMPPAAARPLPSSAQPGNATPPQPGAAPAPKAEDPTSQAVGMFLIQLVSAAENNGDPGLYHDIVVEVLNQEQAERMKMVLGSDDFLEQLYGADPNILARAKMKVTWFQELRQMLLATLNSPDESSISGSASDGGQAGSPPDTE